MVLQGAGCFGGFLASMLLAYLLSTHKVGKTMNAYQLLRNALHFLGKFTLAMSDRLFFKSDSAAYGFV